MLTRTLENLSTLQINLWNLLCPPKIAVCVTTHLKYAISNYAALPQYQTQLVLDNVLEMGMRFNWKVSDLGVLPLNLMLSCCERLENNCCNDTADKTSLHYMFWFK